MRRAVEVFRLLGGVVGYLEGMPKSQLAVVPGTGSLVPPSFGLLVRADSLLELIRPFFDAPMPESG